MTIKGCLQVHFTNEADKLSKYYHEVTEIQYGANNIGAFMIITYYEHMEIQTALHYLDELYIVSDLHNHNRTYYQNYNV